MSIKLKIILILAGGWIFIALTGLLGLMGMGDNNDEIQALYQKNLGLVEKITHVAEFMRNDRIQLLLALQHDPTNTAVYKLHDHKIDAHIEKLAKSIEDASTIINQLKAEKLTEQERRLVEDFVSKREFFVKEGIDPVRNAVVAGRFSEATALTLEKINSLFGPADTAAEAIFAYEGKDAKTVYERAMRSYRNSLIMIISFVVLAIAGSGIIGYIIIRSISRGASALIEASNALSLGDLTKRAGVTGKDELSYISSAFDKMAVSLSEIIAGLAGTVAELTASAALVHENSSGMQAGAETVASQAGNVATAGEEMAATSGEIAQNCQMAAGGAQVVSDEANEGAKIIQNSIEVMGAIADSVRQTAVTVDTLGKRSDQIGNIIETIEDIADQTNLLALNAAIEAARAGEQGRGFAVVADEVRALAERTTKATREISEMIQAIQNETRGAVAAMDEGVREVERGTQEAARSGEAMRKITQQIQDLSMQVHQIATAAEQQTATTSEISGSIIQIMEISTKTSHAARQSADEANKLNLLADALTKNLAEVTIEEDVSLALRKAISAHMIFTGKIKAHLDGSQQLDVNALPTHLTCAFGKWYQTKGAEACGRSAEFRELEGPHAKVHELGKLAVAAWNNGDRGAASQHCQEMLGHSERLIDLLKRLEKQQ